MSPRVHRVPTDCSASLFYQPLRCIEGVLRARAPSQHPPAMPAWIQSLDPSCSARRPRHTFASHRAIAGPPAHRGMHWWTAALEHRSSSRSRRPLVCFARGRRRSSVTCPGKPLLTHTEGLTVQTDDSPPKNNTASIGSVRVTCSALQQGDENLGSRPPVHVSSWARRTRPYRSSRRERADARDGLDNATTGGRGPESEGRVLQQPATARPRVPVRW